MNKFLAGLEGNLYHIDDMLIGYDSYLRAVLNRLQTTGVTLNVHSELRHVAKEIISSRYDSILASVCYTVFVSALTQP